MRFSTTLLSALLLTVPAFAAPKDKTKGLPEANGATSAPEVNDSAMRDAKAKLGTAQGKVERAQEAMTSTLSDLRKKAESAPQISQAQDALRTAQAEYDAATGPILEKVRASKAYEAAQAAKQEATTKKNALQAQSGTPQSEINDAAKVVLEKGHAMTQLETAALASNPQTAALKAKVDAANAALLKARRDAELAVKDDPAVKSAKATLEQAQSEVPPLQTAYNTARERYNADVAARDRAMSEAKRTSTEDTTKKGYMKKKKV